jgi:hypothetical protein
MHLTHSQMLAISVLPSLTLMSLHPRHTVRQGSKNEHCMSDLEVTVTQEFIQWYAWNSSSIVKESFQKAHQRNDRFKPPS